MKSLTLAMLILALGLQLTGCGKKADTEKPIEQIQTEVQTMSVSDLEANAKAYAEKIAGKRKETEETASEMNKLSPADLMGEKGKDVRDKAAKLAAEIAALTQRYQIYADKFREKGGDLSKIQIK